MKNSRIFVFVISIILAITHGLFTFASAIVTENHSGPKIVVLDVEAIQKADGYVKMMRQLDTQKEAMGRKLAKKEESIEKKIQEAEKNKLVQTDKEKEETSKYIEADKKKLQEEVVASNKRLVDLGQKAYTQFFDDVKNAVSSLQKKYKFDVVLPKGVVLYSGDNITDVTDEVIKQLNANYLLQSKNLKHRVINSN